MLYCVLLSRAFVCHVVLHRVSCGVPSYVVWCPIVCHVVLHRVSCGVPSCVVWCPIVCHVVLHRVSCGAPSCVTPSCFTLTRALFFVSSNFYRSQKLMSIEVDPASIARVGDPLSAHRLGEDPVWIGGPRWSPVRESLMPVTLVSVHPVFLSSLAFLSTGSVVLFLVNHYYRRRSRLRRKRLRLINKPSKIGIPDCVE